MSQPTPDPTYVPPNPREAHRPAGDPVRGAFATPLTFLLIALSVAATALAQSPIGGPRLWSALSMSALEFNRNVPATFLPEVLREGQVWRLITPIFLHGGSGGPIVGLIHLLFNMLWLRDLGVLLERRYGPWRYLALILGVALVSSLVQYLVSGPRFGGMSGVVFGLFGYIWILGRMHPTALGFALTQQTVTLMLAWFVLCFIGFLPIANGAHAGGLASGALLGWIVARRTGAEMFARRRDFRQAVTEAEDEPLHLCHVCKRTEQSAPELEFRVSGVDGEEYCTEHLPARTPVQADN